ncbi:hypothetical protein IPF89_02545 [Candidatus Saccharibacteria bacterium]|nr:MAG: hypothetical protein IPF89_02545 [Candidatus Saccharibacteria bacterium]
MLNTSTIWVIAMGYLVLHEELHLSDIVGTVIIMTSVFMLMERKRNIGYTLKNLFSWDCLSD